MKLLDISKSHEDSPEFREGLTQLEGDTAQLEKRLKRICSLCEERHAVAVKERALTQQLIEEFEDIASTGMDCGQNTTRVTNSVGEMTTALKQLIDNQERMFEQINIGIMKPLQHFLTNDLEHIKSTKKTYHKARSEATQAAEKFGQCKKHEMNLLNESSFNLFDARCELHKAACNYAMDLNLLQSKRLPDFLQRVVDFMTSQLSYFHLGHITVKDTEPHITSVYTILEKLRAEATSRDTQQRTKAKELLEEVVFSRSRNLVRLQTEDLHVPMDTAKANVSRLVAKTSPTCSLEGKVLELKERTTSQALTKEGYMCYAEPKTFGTAWIRLYFSIKNGHLVSLEHKVKVPISLSLNLCNVKPAEVVDTERNFCFKVISPSRTLLLQAEGSREMREWREVLTNAITHALQRHSTTPEHELVPPNAMTGGGDASPMPIKPPRRKNNLLKELHSVAGNEVCADCGSSTPKWASVNLGILVCIECSGVHRSLGVYISQSRSLTLDTLKPEWISRLREMGNTKSNALYESQLPEDFERASIRKAEARSKFIMDKYTNMVYTSAEDKERITEERKAVRVESLKKSGVDITKQAQNDQTSEPSQNGNVTSDLQEEEIKDELGDDWVKVKGSEDDMVEKVVESLGLGKDELEETTKNV